MKLNKKAIAGVGLGALALVGGTFAYYNQTATMDNPLKTGKYENEIVEEFTPPTTEIKPGATIAKKVGAQNTGDYPVLVRIRMDEVWRRGDDIIIQGRSEEKENVFNSAEKSTGTGPVVYTAKQADSSGSYIADANGIRQGDVDGEVSTATENADGAAGKWQADEKDQSVVHKELKENDWVFYKGYWYYNKPLEGGQYTSDLLESLSIASNIDLGYYENKDYYCVGESTWNKADIGKKKVDVNGNETDELADTEKQWYEYTISKDNSGKVNSIEVKGPDAKKGTVEDLNADGIVDATDLAKYLSINSDQVLFRRNESKLSDTKKGYADANYTLTITTQFVQATPDAAEAVFEFNAETEGLPEGIKSLLNSLNQDYLKVNAKETSAATP